METSLVPDEITSWLQARGVADPPAVGTLFEALYAELKRRAHGALRRTPAGGTLGTTGLVNEAYLRLSEAGGLEIRNRGHFLALASKTMRFVLLDTARARTRQRRGGGMQRVTLDEAQVMTEAHAEELIALDGALKRLAELEPRLGEAVELHYFGGLTVEEIAEVAGVSARTVKRDLSKARAFLAYSLGGAEPGTDQ
jgi:RNA polymerase sigma factor (TIGR02999 family)